MTITFDRKRKNEMMDVNQCPVLPYVELSPGDGEMIPQQE
jgi:hypothetical protein